jgi:hypothetical protein
MFKVAIDEVDINTFLNSIFQDMIKDLFPNVGCQKGFPVFGRPD